MMSARDHQPLEERARDVLAGNQRGAWTCPAPSVYPHQWLWDSCFIAIGVAHYDPARAADELRALFRGQWANGMLPHMIFSNEVKDAGIRRIWNSKKSPLAPRDVDTSCVTQPPLPAIAVERVAAALPMPDRHAFLAELLPKLIAYHSWLYDDRDVHDSGLITLIHPWECGLDTTPPWMHALSRMPMPWWWPLVGRLHLTRTVRRLRKDTRFIPAAERSSDDDGLRMLLLVSRAKRHGFELRQMPTDTSVLIEDLSFNAMLAAANRSLERIAGLLDQPVPHELAQHARRTVAAFEQLWDEESGQYYSRDVTTGALIKIPTIATFVPLWAGIPTPQRVEKLLGLLHTAEKFWPPYPVPSVPVDAPEFEEARYWKGPTWVNMSWTIVEGLREYGQLELASELAAQLVQLVEQAGFSEYFSPLTGAPYGAENFSWTAALIVDLLARPFTSPER